MWSSLDVFLAVCFMAAATAVIIAGTGVLVMAFCLFVGKRTAG